MNEWINEWINQWINQSINQSINHPINKSINQSIDEPTNEWMKQWNIKKERANEWMIMKPNVTKVKILVASKKERNIFTSLECDDFEGMRYRFWVWGRQSTHMHLVHDPSSPNCTWSMYVHVASVPPVTFDKLSQEGLQTSCILWKAYPLVGSRSCSLLCPQSVFSGSQIFQTICQWVEGDFHFYQWSSHP